MKFVSLFDPNTSLHRQLIVREHYQYLRLEGWVNEYYAPYKILKFNKVDKVTLILILRHLTFVTRVQIVGYP